MTPTCARAQVHAHDVENLGRQGPVDRRKQTGARPTRGSGCPDPDEEVSSIAQRFQSAGVKVVVGVGGAGSETWPHALLDNQSSYKPVFIASDESGLSFNASGVTSNPYLDNVLSANISAQSLSAMARPRDEEVRCHRSQPSQRQLLVLVNPSSAAAATASTATPYVGVEEACCSIRLSLARSPMLLEEADSCKLHQGRLWAEKRYPPGVRWPCVLRPDSRTPSAAPGARL